MEEVAAGFLPPTLADMLVMLSVVLNVFLLFGVFYLFVTRSQDSRFARLDDKIKRVANDLKILDEKVRNIKPAKVVDTVPEIDAFGVKANAPREVSAEKSAAWTKFVENYNLIAASMLVPGQLKACQKFVEENGLRMLQYSGMMNFIPALDVEESIVWLWKMSPKSNQYAAVPNPLKACDEDLYERGGLKVVFAMNFQSGTYKKYIVETPAMFTVDSSNSWKLQDPGVVDLARK